MNEQDRQLTEAMNTYGDYLLRLIYTYVRDWQTAEDLTQETFIRYYHSLAKFRGQASVKTYLYRIAVNVCHDYLASWKYKKIVVSELFQKLLKTNTTPEAEFIEKDEQLYLVTAIESLPRKYKEVLVLFHFVELSLEEVSQVLSLPINTVKTRLRRARQMLGVTLVEGGEVDARSNS